VTFLTEAVVPLSAAGASLCVTGVLIGALRQHSRVPGDNPHVRSQ
jgi:hypothetical protein